MLRDSFHLPIITFQLIFPFLSLFTILSALSNNTAEYTCNGTILIIPPFFLCAEFHFQKKRKEHNSTVPSVQFKCEPHSERYEFDSQARVALKIVFKAYTKEKGNYLSRAVLNYFLVEYLFFFFVAKKNGLTFF